MTLREQIGKNRQAKHLKGEATVLWRKDRPNKEMFPEEQHAYRIKEGASGCVGQQSPGRLSPTAATGIPSGVVVVIALVIVVAVTPSPSHKHQKGRKGHQRATGNIKERQQARRHLLSRDGDEGGVRSRVAQLTAESVAGGDRLRVEPRAQ